MVKGMEGVNIPDTERNPIADFVSFLTNVKTDIINFLTAGFRTQNNDSHQHSALHPTSSQVLHHPPHLPPNVHHHLPPSHYPGQLSSHPPHHKTPHSYPHVSVTPDNSNQEPAPITDINIPAQVQHVEKPGEAKENDIVDQVTTSPINSENTTVVRLEDTKSDSEDDDITKTVELNNDSQESFVDNNSKVNAAIELTTHTDEKIVNNIPEDLWREDFTEIKSKNTHKLGKKIRKVKRLKTIQETTPSDPQLVIE